MQTIEDLKRHIESTQDLQSVVKTMKALAAVNIRQHEKAVESLEDYNRTVEMALRAVLRVRPDLPVGARAAPPGELGAVVFGSDQGMCGQLNDQVVDHALSEIGHSPVREPRLVVVGARTAARLEDAGWAVQKVLAVPSSVTAITPRVQDLLVQIQRWHAEKGVNRVLLFYGKPLSGASYRPHTVHLLPLDVQWLRQLRQQEWPTRALPLFRMDWDPLFSALIREYLFVSLFRAFAESLASENASRLASMQGAEKNIEERLAELNNRFHRQRQMSITEELLDIVSGFEALQRPR
jgi:F-type H+-transporting ATPase subunit gamma